MDIAAAPGILRRRQDIAAVGFSSLLLHAIIVTQKIGL